MGTYEWYFVILWMQIQWWRYHDVVRTINLYHICKRICLNFLHSQVTGVQKLQVWVLASMHQYSCHYLRPRSTVMELSQHLVDQLLDDFFLQTYALRHAWSMTMTTLIFLQVSNSHPTLDSSNHVVIEYHLLSNHYKLSQSQETQVSAEHFGALSIALKHEGTPHKNELTGYNFIVIWLGFVITD